MNIKRFRNTCLTYFLVVHDENFDLKDFCDLLDLDYDYYLQFNTVDFLEIGRNEIYNVNINEMIRITLQDLFGKVDMLNKLKEKYNLTYYLERVPSLVESSDEPTPILSLESDIIEFLYKTNTIDDLDYYIAAIYEDE